MKILFFVGVYLPRTGGVPINTHKMVSRLVDKGLDVRVLAPHEVGDNNLVTNYFIYRYPRYPIRHFFSRSYLLWLYNIYKKWPFDLIHCHGVDPAGYCTSYFKKFASIPYIVTLRKSNFFKKETHFFNKRRNKRAKTALINADRITAISKKIFRIIEGSGVPSSKIVYIPHGIDPSIYEGVRPLNWPNPYILSVGRLVKFKGFDLLIKAFSDISKKISNLDLVIIGKGPKEQELRSLIKSLDIENRVYLLGEKRGKEKYSFYKGALFYVLSSYPGSEGFPNVILEAMAAHLPIISTKVSGAEDAVVDGVTGYLVPPNDRKALSDKMLYLIKNPNMIQKINIKKELEKYNISKVIQNYIDVYSSVIK